MKLVTTIFDPTIHAAISTCQDGDMRYGENNPQVAFIREAFLKKNDISIDHCVLVKMVYGKEDFTQYREVTSAEAGLGMREDNMHPADGLATKEPGLALFLPLADCVGAILHDPEEGVLMVSHLGRHNVEQEGGRKSVEFLAERFGCNPLNIHVWLSPAIGAEQYPLFAFGGRGLHDVVLEQLEAAGVRLSHIEVSPVNTAISDEFYSHSEFLKGNRSDDGRFAIVAQMVEQGEPA